MLSIHKRPTSVILSEIIHKTIRQSCLNYGFDYKKFYDIVMNPSSTAEEFENALNAELLQNLERVEKKLARKGLVSLKQFELNITNIGNLISAMYTFQKSKRFLYNTKCSKYLEFIIRDLPDEIAQYDFMDCFDDIDDIILDLGGTAGYFNLMIRLCRTTYSVSSKKGQDLPAFNLTYLSYIDGKSTVMGQTSIVKGIYPNLLMDNEATVMRCVMDGHCPRRVALDTELTGSDGVRVHKQFCYMTPKKIAEHACSIDILQPYKVLKIIAYVWDMYNHRHTLKRKNSKRGKSYKTHEVSTISREDNVIRPLHTYYRYEREHKPWQGGHHQSPVEHERRPHERRYFDKEGKLTKVVQVRGSTVNKGGKKAILKIDTPDNKMDLF